MTTPPTPFPGGGAPHPATDPAAVHAAVQTALWDTAEQEGCRFTPGTLERLANAAVNAIAHNGAELEQRLANERRRTYDALAPLLREHPLTREDVHGDNLTAGYLAESARDLIRNQGRELAEWRDGKRTVFRHDLSRVLAALRPAVQHEEDVTDNAVVLAELAAEELRQWRRGIRITQESSDQQDRAVKAEHELADTRHRLEAAETAMAGMVSDLDDAHAEVKNLNAQIATIKAHHQRRCDRLTAARDQARAKAANASGRAVDLAGRLDRVRQALDTTPVDPFAPGTRVKVGECYGTVRHDLVRRVKVQLDGSPVAARFASGFVHPVTDADPPPADLAPNVQHAVNPLQVGDTVRITGSTKAGNVGTVIEPPARMYADDPVPRVRVEVVETTTSDFTPLVTEVQRVTVLKPQEG